MARPLNFAFSAFQNELHTNQLFLTCGFGTNLSKRVSLACIGAAHVLICSALE